MTHKRLKEKQRHNEKISLSLACPPNSFGKVRTKQTMNGIVKSITPTTPYQLVTHKKTKREATTELQFSLTIDFAISLECISLNADCIFF